MAGNFIKGGFVKLEDSNKLVIDNNEIIKKKLEEIRNTMISMEESSGEEVLSEFSEGINPVQVSLLVSDDGEGSVLDDIDGFQDGLSASSVSSGNIIHSVNDKANEKALEEYEQIIAKANEEAEEIKNKAREDGYNEGFNQGHDEGISQGIADAKTALENEYNQKALDIQNEYQEMLSQHNAEYETRLNDLEPMLVNKIMDIIKHVTGVDLEGNKDVITCILKSALENMDSGRHYLIHVSPVDFENVKSSKSDIAKGTGLTENDFEFIEDNSVPANGALIESEAGIFDCGLGSQLELLKKKLLLISYQD